MTGEIPAAPRAQSSEASNVERGAHNVLPASAPPSAGYDDILKPGDYPELVFGLVGPLGADYSRLVVDNLNRELVALGYRVHEIRLSRLIERLVGRDYSSEPEDQRIDALMTEGTSIREKTDRGDTVALLAIGEILDVRKKVFNGEFAKNAYVLISLKHPAELDTLRNVYGQGFFAVSTYAPRSVRIDVLEKLFASSRTSARNIEFNPRARAEYLVGRDEHEEGRALGQDIKDAFPESDVFIDASSGNRIEPALQRFVRLVFSHPFVTPSLDEYAMFHATAAAARSADLGRQVGAAIATTEGDVIAVGCNEVPKAGGGLYWTGDAGDNRDFHRGYDSNVESKEQLLVELVTQLQTNGLLDPKYGRTTAKELVNAALYGDSPFLKRTQIVDLLEFGRSVHAEMAALMDAARRGVPVKGATLYSTTFPCHLCARHIVAAGIRRVVYIEPYPKSRAGALYSDSIAIDPVGPIKDRVSFEPFVGIAPRQYLRFFEIGPDDRKGRTGKVKAWQRRPRLARFLNSYRDVEIAIAGAVIPEIQRQIRSNT
jgi:deoxycytidylate deaminase